MNGGDDKTPEELSFAEITMAEEPSIGDEVDIALPADISLGFDAERPTPEEVVRLLDQIRDHLSRLELDDYVRSDLLKELGGVGQLLQDEAAPRELLSIAMEALTKKLEAVYDTGEDVHQLLPWAHMAQDMVRTLYAEE